MSTLGTGAASGKRLRSDTTPPPDQRRPAYEPDLSRASFTLLRRADNLTHAHQAHLDRRFDAHPRRRTAGKAPREPSANSTRPKTSTGANQALGRFADLYATGQIPGYHQTADTIVAREKKYLATTAADRPPTYPPKGSTTSSKSYAESPTACSIAAMSRSNRAFSS